MKIRFALFFLLPLFLSCVPSLSATEQWLQDYNVLLQENIRMIRLSPISPQADALQTKIAQKESEIEKLLQEVSRQEQIDFLARYYDMRVSFYYANQ